MREMALTKPKLKQRGITMEKTIQNEINREIRAFNKTITPSTTNKEIWNKKVELSNKYGLRIIGKYENENEKQNKYKMIGTVKKGENAIYIVVEPKAIEIGEAEIEEVEIPIL